MILTLETGVPVTPLIGGDPFGLNDGDAFACPNPLSGCSTVTGRINNYINANRCALPMATPAIAAFCTPFPHAAVSGTCQNLLGNSGRNTVVDPGLATLDFSLFKNDCIQKCQKISTCNFGPSFLIR